MQQQESQTGLVVGIIVVTVLLFAGLTWFILQAPQDTRTPSGVGEIEPSLTFNDQSDPTFGPTNAQVVVRLFGDFQCPACRLAEPAVQAMMKKYAERVRFIWKDFPLTQIHANARGSANAARCAEVQGMFWQYHDVLYAKQDEWSNLTNPRETFTTYANELGLNGTTFSACLAGQKEDAKVAAGIAEGARNDVDRTPTFFVGKRRYFGMTLTEWDAAIQKAIEEASSTTTPNVVE